MCRIATRLRQGIGSSQISFDKALVEPVSSLVLVLTMPEGSNAGRNRSTHSGIGIAHAKLDAQSPADAANVLPPSLSNVLGTVRMGAMGN